MEKMRVSFIYYISERNSKGHTVSQFLDKVLQSLLLCCASMTEEHSHSKGNFISEVVSNSGKCVVFF